MWEVRLDARPAGWRGARPRCRWAATEASQEPKRCAEPPISDQAPLVWRAPDGPKGQAAVPVGGNGG